MMVTAPPVPPPPPFPPPPFPPPPPPPPLPPPPPPPWPPKQPTISTLSNATRRNGALGLCAGMAAPRNLVYSYRRYRTQCGAYTSITLGGRQASWPRLAAPNPSKGAA